MIESADTAQAEAPSEAGLCGLRADTIIESPDAVQAEAPRNDAAETPSEVGLCGLLWGLLKVIWPIILLCLITAIVSVLVREQLLELCRWIDERPIALAATMFVLLFVVWVLCWLPTTILELTAGFIFGIWWGCLVSTLGKVFGGGATFLVARYCAKQYVTEHIVVQTPILVALSRLLEEHEVHTVFLVISLASHGCGSHGCYVQIMLCFLNYSLKTSSLGTLPCRAAVFLCAVTCTGAPFALVGAHLGASLKTIAEAAGGGSSLSPSQIATLSVGIAASLVVLAGVTVYTNRELSRLTSAVGCGEVRGRACDQGVVRGPEQGLPAQPETAAALVHVAV